jgi:hypothetical protein
MTAKTERKIAAAGMAGAVLAILAAMLVLSGLMVGLGARDDRAVMTASTGNHR